MMETAEAQTVALGILAFVAIISGVIARRKNRSVLQWTLLGLVAPYSLLVLLALKALPSESAIKDASFVTSGKEMVRNPRWIALSVLSVVVGVISLAPLVMLPMAFDAPGSEKNGALIAMVLIAGLFPVSCLLGAILPWIFRPRPFAAWLFALPGLNIVGIGLCLLALSLGQEGAH